VTAILDYIDAVPPLTFDQLVTFVIPMVIAQSILILAIFWRLK
jgi:hypothetical protein